MGSRKVLRVQANPKTLQVLAAETNRVLEMLGSQILEMDRPKSPVSNLGQRLTDVGQPFLPNDVVRLADLREAISQAKTELSVKTSSSGGGGGSSPPASVFSWWEENTFLEPFDGVRFVFTPSPALKVVGGIPYGLLVNHQGAMRFSSGGSPEPGEWVIQGDGQIEVHPADAPLAGDYFGFAFVEVES